MSDEAAHILVIDDDDRLRDLLQRYLGEYGFRVSTASSAAEARIALSGLSFDLLVLDLMMPGESGLALTKDIRRTDNLPILLLTAMGEAEDRISGLEVGADDYLAKPLFARRPGVTVGRAELLTQSDAGNVRAVDVQITRLRRKIEDDPKEPRHLCTVWGQGYVFWVD
jgi:two-component system phosphate regulon response regulator OmpR